MTASLLGKEDMHRTRPCHKPHDPRSTAETRGGRRAPAPTKPVATIAANTAAHLVIPASLDFRWTSAKVAREPWQPCGTARASSVMKITQAGPRSLNNAPGLASIANKPNMIFSRGSIRLHR